MRKIIARSRCNSFDSVCSNISNASVADEYEIIDKDYEQLKKQLKEELKEQYNNLEKMQQDLEKRQKELEKKQYKLEKRQEKLEKRENILNAKFNKTIKKENIDENIEVEVKELMRCMLNEVERRIDREELEAIGWTHSGRLECVIT